MIVIFLEILVTKAVVFGRCCIQARGRCRFEAFRFAPVCQSLEEIGSNPGVGIIRLRIPLHFLYDILNGFGV